MKIHRRADSNEDYSHKNMFWDWALVCNLLFCTAKHKILDFFIIIELYSLLSPQLSYFVFNFLIVCFCSFALPIPVIPVFLTYTFLHSSSGVGMFTDGRYRAGGKRPHKKKLVGSNSKRANS